MCHTDSADADTAAAAADDVMCDVIVSVRLRKEVVDGLRIMFDFTLPLILLYDSERTQYQHVSQPQPIKLSVSLCLYFLLIIAALIVLCHL